MPSPIRLPRNMLGASSRNMILPVYITFHIIDHDHLTPGERRAILDLCTRAYAEPFDDYMKLYFIGHYNPRGNHFFAYSIKDKIVSWLDPKPVPYRNRDETSVDLQEYLKTVR